MHAKERTRTPRKSDPQWTRDFNIRPETLKLLGENVAEKTLATRGVNHFLGEPPEGYGNTTRNQRAGLRCREATRQQREPLSRQGPRDRSKLQPVSAAELTPAVTEPTRLNSKKENPTKTRAEDPRRRFPQTHERPTGARKRARHTRSPGRPSQSRGGAASPSQEASPER